MLRLFTINRSITSSTIIGRRWSSTYDCAIVGAGHNGLVAAAYLQKLGLRTAVFERRHIVGGAACTEEVVPGFRFSRCSYLLSLLRPRIAADLGLTAERGFRLLRRDPASFTPCLETGRALTIGPDLEETMREIEATSSKRDAIAYKEFDEFLRLLRAAVWPLMDEPAASMERPRTSMEWIRKTLGLRKEDWLLTMAIVKLRNRLPQAMRMLTSSCGKLLNERFDCDLLKATVATDALIGCAAGPWTPGTGPTMLVHVIGDEWGYVEGGMGRLSEIIADVCRERGVEIFVDSEVERLLVDDKNHVEGVRLANGTAIQARCVLSNATPHVTFNELLPNALDDATQRRIDSIDYRSATCKINVAVSTLPQFLPDFHHSHYSARAPAPALLDPLAKPHHQTTIHLHSSSLAQLDRAYGQFAAGQASTEPFIEMTIPSVVDATLAPPGAHVVNLFTQYYPYEDDESDAYAQRVFAAIDRYAPGFLRSIVGYEVLTPRRLESEFGLTGGNIFHGAMTLDQSYSARPSERMSSTRTPVEGLYLCGSGVHPGGGVSGSPGRLAARAVCRDLGKKFG